MDYTVALLQTKPKLGCLLDNLHLMEESIEKAYKKGANLVLFPELSLTGYFLKDLVVDVGCSLDSPPIQRLKKLSKKCSIAFGFAEASEDYQFFNSALYLEDGEIKGHHRKVYLPTYGLFDEQRYFAKGEHFKAFDTKFGKMGFTICEDMWHLSSSYILALDGATQILCLSSSPGKGISEKETLDSISQWQKILETIPLLLNMRTLFCNRVGYEDGVGFWGGSQVVDPAGSLVKRGKIFEEDLVLVDLDEGSLRREKIFYPILRDENLSLTMKELHRIQQEKDCT